VSFLSEVRLESRFGPFVVFQENLGFIPNLTDITSPRQYVMLNSTIGHTTFPHWVFLPGRQT